jgi:hypothetical protein
VTLPSHCRLPQSFAASASHAARAPCGAPTTGVHVPTWPETSHAAHASAHAWSQHTPSTQLPLPHSLAVAQLVPSTFAQLPGGLPALHARPAPHEASEQQTPSVQKPDVHASFAVHGEPSAPVGVHAPPEQNEPLAQSVSFAHDVLHAAVEASHPYGAHGRGVAVPQAPAPVHVGAGSVLLPEHDAAPHVVVDPFA